MGVLLKERVNAYGSLCNQHCHCPDYRISISVSGYPTASREWGVPDKYLDAAQRPYLGNYQMILKPDFLRYFSQQCYCVCNQRVHYCSGIFHDFLYICQNALSGKKSAVLCYYRRNDDSCTYDPDSYVYPVKQYRTDRFLAGLVGPYVSYNIPIAVFILTQFFRKSQRAGGRAAIIDGCSIVGTFKNIILPLSGPAISTIMVYTFLNIWNEFINANVLIISSAE